MAKPYHPENESENEASGENTKQIERLHNLPIPVFDTSIPPCLTSSSSRGRRLAMHYNFAPLSITPAYFSENYQYRSIQRPAYQRLPPRRPIRKLEYFTSAAQIGPSPQSYGGYRRLAEVGEDDSSGFRWDIVRGIANGIVALGVTVGFVFGLDGDNCFFLRCWNGFVTCCCCFVV